ncbi:hypothetical protein [Leeuwenhoekiella aestuarii]|uniref:Phosphate-selective porin O/P n=1 Tax=Leeuwenhoekiella aestuarii TaxID=2249426 RepID=A0A4V1KP17_9FLAO|nr:hypothetical protein [Leeuwenhoekiella aestuarii]RXG13221.1 hypothetical protein DSM04_105199 [Leeuwenhoekiella aestuarii]
MKTKLTYLTLISLSFFGMTLQAQSQRDLDNYRSPDQRGISTFEAPKDTVTTFDGVHVRIGGASTIQFQAIDHENSSNPDTPVLQEIGSNFNLATANLDLDVALYDGVRMHLRTYLSSQHHNETYVKGGYFQIDKLEFIQKGFMEDVMNHVRIKIGHMESNYGDAHFRRTDNAMALYNPFVGNYLMDSFTTEVGAELYYFDNGWMGMLSLTNGKLNQAVTKPETTSPSFIAKLGYDKAVSEALRVRLTGSLYKTNQTASAYLYSGDRSGSRYYNVMIAEDGSGDGFRAGRINPGLSNELTSIMINPFLKYKGLEFFGIYEHATGKTAAETDSRSWNQYSGELIYRFGSKENIYLGGRYNYVDGTLVGGSDVSIDRFQLAAGWFMTKNILLKAEYVVQNYNDYPVVDLHNDAKFDGFMLEAAISF